MDSIAPASKGGDAIHQCPRADSWLLREDFRPLARIVPRTACVAPPVRCRQCTAHQASPNRLLVPRVDAERIQFPFEDLKMQGGIASNQGNVVFLILEVG